MYSVMAIPWRFSDRENSRLRERKEQGYSTEILESAPERADHQKQNGMIYTPDMVLGPATKGNQGLLIQQIPDLQNLFCEMQRNRICLSVKECTEKMTKQTKHADTSI